MHPRTEGFDGRRHLGQLALPIHLSFSLLLLHRQGVVLLLKFLAPPLVFGSGEHALQLSFCQALELMGYTHLAFAQRFFAGLEFLWEPMASMRTLQGVGHVLWVGEEVTQVLPDKRIELLGWAVPGCTAPVMLRIQGLSRTATYIVAMAMLCRPRNAGGLADPTADQRS